MVVRCQTLQIMKHLLWLLLALPIHAQQPKTAQAVAGPWTKSVTLPAEALPYHRATLGTPVTGWVGDLHADIGAKVKKGDVLATIEAPELVAAAEARAEEARAAQQGIVQATALLASAEAEAVAARSELERISRLAETGTVTTKAKDEAQARASAAEAKVGQTKAGMAGAEAESLAATARAKEAAAALAFTRITAPFDGLVVARHAEPGDFLGTNSMRGKLFVLEQTDPLRVRMFIPEHSAALANAGDAVTLSLNGVSISSKLDRVSGSLDPITKTMAAEIDVKTPGILAGTMGNATLTLATMESAIRVPLAAIQTAADGSHFVKILENGNSRDVPVVLAAVDGKLAILSSGPTHGAAVIIP